MQKHSVRYCPISMLPALPLAQYYVYMNKGRCQVYPGGGGGGVIEGNLIEQVIILERIFP